MAANRTLAKRATTALAGVAVALLCALGAPQAASAADYPVDLSDADVAQFLENAEYWGVDDATADLLLEKVRNGIPLDSMTGAAPITTTTSQVNGIERTLKTYSDGSIIGTEMEIPKAVPPGTITPLAGFGGCTRGTSAGVSYAQDCYVYNSGLTVGASFYTSYSRWSGGSSVWNWHTPTYNVIGGNVTNAQFTQPNGYTIQLRFNVNTLGYPTSTAWLQLNASIPAAQSGGTW